MIINEGHLGQAFHAALVKYAEKTAIVDKGHAISYAKLARWSASIGITLRKCGVKPGDFVAFYIGNRPEFIACDIAIAMIGAVKLPVNALLPAHTVSYILDNSEARAVIVDPRLEEMAAKAIEDRSLLVFGFDSSASALGERVIRIDLDAVGVTPLPFDVASVERMDVPGADDDLSSARRDRCGRRHRKISASRHDRIRCGTDCAYPPAAGA